MHKFLSIALVAGVVFGATQAHASANVEQINVKQIFMGVELKKIDLSKADLKSETKKADEQEVAGYWGPYGYVVTYNCGYNAWGQPVCGWY